MRFLADLAYLTAALVYAPKLAYDALFLKKNRTGWRQRLGGVPRFNSQSPRIWVHGVSLGEINATPRLIEELRQRVPDAEVVISTTTDTGFARALALYGPDRVFRFPLDFSPVVGRVLRRVRPSLIVLVELEVWYNLVRMSHARQIPVAVVNGRLTERSARRFEMLGRLGRGMFSRLAWVGAQDDATAARFRRVGVPPDRISTTSSMKWDTAAVTDRVEGAEVLASQIGLPAGQPLWVCGSTGPGEEAMILDAYARLGSVPAVARHVQGEGRDQSARAAVPLLAIVPRKPERFDEVARLIESRGLRCVRRSRPAADAGGTPGTDCVILGDTMGELRKFYALAQVVFVGRSLVPLGGSDPMEVAALGRVPLIGPHTDNFLAPVEALRQAGALFVVHSPAELASAVAGLVASPDEARRLGALARQVVLDNQGATRRSADALVELLGREPQQAASAAGLRGVSPGGHQAPAGGW